MARSPVAKRTSFPLLLAVAGLVGWVLAPGHPLLILPLLFAPGWGALRLVSVIDRNFAALACALTLSPLVAGLMTQLAAQQDWGTARLGLALHIASVGLCLIGRLRMSLYDRWRTRQPPHPAPMPLWPAHAGIALLIVLLMVATVVRVNPPQVPHVGDPRIAVASRAVAWMSTGEQPLAAGAALPASDLMASASAALSAATGSHPLLTVQALSLSALAACLLFAVECISRLKGNRGGLRALAALLLGLNPLAGIFLLGAPENAPLSEHLTAGFDPRLTVALDPFLRASPLALTLAFVSMLHFASLSVIRRASKHVPRLITLATLGLLLSAPQLGLLLLPGWLVGFLLSHLACRDSADNDPTLGAAAHRTGDPAILRAPFWRPTLHVAAGALLALPLLVAPEYEVALSRTVAWGLLAAVGPGCLLFMPGVRHLNASPGREAYFYVGMIALTALAGVLVGIPGDQGELVARMLALLLAVPAANGAMKMVEIHGARAGLLLTLLALIALPGSLAVLHDRTLLPRPLTLRRDGSLRMNASTPGRGAALARVAEQAPARAALLVDAATAQPSAHLAHLLARRPLLVDPMNAEAGERHRLLNELAAGDGTALQSVRSLPGLAARELWAVHEGGGWPGFEPVTRIGKWRVERTRTPNVLLVTVSSLRADRVAAEYMPRFVEASSAGLRFENAVTPAPATTSGLATLLTGLDPTDHDLRHATRPLSPDAPRLASRYGQRGYRTTALVALPEESSLLSGFEFVVAEPAARVEHLVDAALSQLAVVDPRPLFLWVHLSDLSLPYQVPHARRDAHTGETPFPDDRTPEEVAFTVVEFPPSAVAQFVGAELDTQRGVAQYDALVGHLDEQLERLVRSVGEQDLFVLTSPHGTSLTEHASWFDHGHDLYEPSIHVPLVVLGAGMPLMSSERLVSLADVSELLLDGKVPSRERVLLESRERPGLGSARAYEAELDPDSRGLARHIWGERRATEKLILTRTLESEKGLGGLRFDLVADPDELRGELAPASTLRRIDSWRRRGSPPRVGETAEKG